MKREIARSQQPAPPDCLTVDEAAAVLRISRTKAYAQVNEYLDGVCDAGIPAIRIARQIRVPRAALEERLGGPITWPIPKSPANPRASTARNTSPHRNRLDSRIPRESAQLSLAIEP